MHPLKNITHLLRGSLNGVLFTCVVIFFVVDITRDIYNGAINIELLFEGPIFILASVLLFHEMSVNQQAQHQIVTEQSKVTRLSGYLHEHIDAQLLEWRFTKSEKEIAWLLLRGYSFQEIAEVRTTKEKTVRQQATAIYSKSATKNRSEFVSHFMSDLLASEHLHTPHPIPLKETP